MTKRSKHDKIIRLATELERLDPAALRQVLAELKATVAAKGVKS